MAVWVLVGIGVVAVVVLAAAAIFRRERHADLGTVSDQWIAEQRLGSSNESQR